MAERMREEPTPAERREDWQSRAAVDSRRRLGIGITVMVILLFVLPVVAKFFRWF